MERDFKNVGSLPRGMRNNNPGNIRGVGWKGEVGVDGGGFAIFSSVVWGLRALARDLKTAINEGYDNIDKLINHYAPGYENPGVVSGSYQATVSGVSGISETEQLGTDDDTILSLVKGIITVECGSIYAAMIDDSEYVQAINLSDNIVSSTAKEVVVSLGELPLQTVGSGVAVDKSTCIPVVLILMFLGLVVHAVRFR